jgi:Arc/MetJ family transcription regulator
VFVGFGWDHSNDENKYKTPKLFCPERHQNSVRSGAIIGVKGKEMRASVTLDDDLLKTAHEYTGVTERAELLREALKSIIAREAGRRLLALAGTAPNIKDVRRRRVDEP